MIPSYLLPEGTRYFIAGGWAACPALATDRDVWLLSRDPVETRDAVLKHLDATLFDDEWKELPDGRVTAVDGSEDAYGVDATTTLKIATVDLTGQTIHLLVTSGSILAVLDTFDISTHQVAISDTGGVVRGRNWTPVTEPPIKLRDTPTTDERMAKIAARYGHALPMFTFGEVGI
jgi:hypothetical protein